MKIYKNSSYVKLELDEFLGLLEEDALDEIIYMITDLDNSGSINGDDDGDYDDEFLDVLEGYAGDISDILMGDFPSVVYYQEGLDLADLMEIFPDDTEFHPVSADFNESMIGDFPGYESGMVAGESLMDNLLLSNEDLRVRKIVKRFSHLLDE